MMMFIKWVKSRCYQFSTIACSSMLVFSVSASEASLPKEVSELKPRCDQVMRDIRDEKIDEIIKGYHPMMQQWQDGKRARKLIELSLGGYKRASGGGELIDFMMFDPESSGFMEPSANLKGNYPNTTRVITINYSYNFIKPNGQSRTGGTRCILFEDDGQWYFYDDLPF
ncbi:MULTISPECIES: hypothetical protein [unclassified Shewanella]|jgi:hypothetical protein|uniref:hypothetical protein n=1 Tax=unclassified Shewanella TaxID=196818 RepID=UPI0015FEDAEC|nr:MULTISPECIES: hypothetical protein [unclassified Shewanella]MBB1361262.1 hypothetical protein [Shewanella sp. SR44-4]MBO1896303.1 hypothetical protein [Shewanella sp. BF02_Schw]